MAMAQYSALFTLGLLNEHTSEQRTFLTLGSPASPRLSSRSRSRRPSRERLPEPKPAPSKSLPVPPSFLLLSPTTSTHSHRVSIVSTGTSVRTARKQAAHRDDALAHLEGHRTPQPSSPTRLRNFMSMSDDEDDTPAPSLRSRKRASMTALPSKPKRWTKRSSVSSLLSFRRSPADSWLANFLDFEGREDEGNAPLAARAT